VKSVLDDKKALSRDMATEGARSAPVGAHIRPTTRACSAALFPVCDVPSSLQIFLRSLLMSVLERSVMVAAICCRLDEAMAGCSCGWYSSR
jgi:hypothetical protein